MKFCIKGEYWYIPSPEIKFAFEGTLEINGCNRIKGQVHDILGVAEIHGYYSRLFQKNFYFMKQYVAENSSRYASPNPIYFSFTEEKNLNYKGTWQIITEDGKKTDSQDPQEEKKYSDNIATEIISIMVSLAIGNPEVGKCHCVLSSNPKDIEETEKRAEKRFSTEEIDNKMRELIVPKTETIILYPFY